MKKRSILDLGTRIGASFMILGLFLTIIVVCIVNFSYGFSTIKGPLYKHFSYAIPDVKLFNALRKISSLHATEINLWLTILTCD